MTTMEQYHNLTGQGGLVNKNLNVQCYYNEINILNILTHLDYSVDNRPNFRTGRGGRFDTNLSKSTY